MGNKNNPNRRRVLKGAGAAFIGSSLFATTTSAASSNKETCTSCDRITIVNDSNKSRTFISKRNGKTYQFTIDKETGRTDGGKIADTTDIGLEGLPRITTQEQDNIFRRIEAKAVKRGRCGGVFAKYHYGITLATVKGNQYDNVESSIIADALCGGVGALLGGLAGAAFGVIVCNTLTGVLVDRIDVAGQKVTIGAWDTHSGFLGTEEVSIGSVNKFTLNWRDLHKFKAIPGHIGMGAEIGDPY